jgi:hypothetical protein
MLMLQNVTKCEEMLQNVKNCYNSTNVLFENDSHSHGGKWYKCTNTKLASSYTKLASSNFLLYKAS